MTYQLMTVQAFCRHPGPVRCVQGNSWCINSLRARRRFDAYPVPPYDVGLCIKTKIRI